MSDAGVRRAQVGPTMAFADRIIAWQRRSGRHDLPWQQNADPYRVWLSEIMLQQTQVQTVIPYYHRFLRRFPTVHDLARASDDEVLGLWSGLGYYTRARNLLRAARQIVQEHGGRLPTTAERLVQLPGVGPSTAAAIAAFCFGQRISIFDGNVKRVFSRYWGIGDDLSRAAPARALQQRAQSVLPEADLRRRMPAYTQGLMDLGALICTPRAPQCSACPLQSDCRAFAEGDPERYPQRRKRAPRPVLELWLLHACDDQGRVWLQRRPAHGIWARLHCLPVFSSGPALERALPAACRGATTWHPAFEHALTHRQLLLHVCSVQAGANPLRLPGGRWFGLAQWQVLGLPAPVRKFLRQQQAAAR